MNAVLCGLPEKPELDGNQKSIQLTNKKTKNMLTKNNFFALIRGGRIMENEIYVK